MRFHYHTYRIPKQSGGTRLITAPSRTLKHFQRALVDLETNRWPLEPSATGFRPGSSVVENAMPHVGKRLVVNVDLKGFFPNTKFPGFSRFCISVSTAGSPRGR